MRRNILTNGEIVKPHKPGLEELEPFAHTTGMDGRDKIAKRLIAFQKTTDHTGPELAVIIGAKENAWIQWTGAKYKRIIPKSYASKLCEKFELTLEWIYRGVPASRVPEHIRDLDIGAIELTASTRRTRSKKKLSLSVRRRA